MTTTAIKLQVATQIDIQNFLLSLEIGNEYTIEIDKKIYYQFKNFERKNLAKFYLNCLRKGESFYSLIVYSKDLTPARKPIGRWNDSRKKDTAPTKRAIVKRDKHRPKTAPNKNKYYGDVQVGEYSENGQYSEKDYYALLNEIIWYQSNFGNFAKPHKHFNTW